MELYKQIKRYRTDMNLSQEELAEKIYVTRQTISNWENDKSYPDIHSLLLLSSTFHISLVKWASEVFCPLFEFLCGLRFMTRKGCY